MLRYAKGKPLAPAVGGFQSAAAFGILKEYDAEEGAEADKTICVTLDALPGAELRRQHVHQHESGLPDHRGTVA